MKGLSSGRDKRVGSCIIYCYDKSESYWGMYNVIYLYGDCEGIITRVGSPTGCSAMNRIMNGAMKGG